MFAQRVVSLIPSGTEIVCALGFKPQLIGRSHECDYPAWVRRLPICTEPRFSIEGTSAEINVCVQAVLREAVSVYNVHADVLKQLQPDIIVTQSQCEVCAVSLSEVERVACQLFEVSARVVGLEPNGLVDVFRDIEQVADALEVPERGVQLVEALRQRMASIYERAQPLPCRPTVACIEWLDPAMVAGNWIPELVEMAGGINIFGEAGQHSSWLQWDDLLAKDPEIIVLLPCGFDIARTRRDLPALTSQPGWAGLRAVHDQRVYVTDGNQYFNRPGPRLVESLEILAEIFHPNTFHFGHAGIGWQPL